MITHPITSFYMWYKWELMRVCGCGDLEELIDKTALGIFSGNFGVVYKGVLKRDEEVTDVAVKTIKSELSTHWRRKEMSGVLQMTFSFAFWWIKMFDFSFIWLNWFPWIKRIDKSTLVRVMARWQAVTQAIGLNQQWPSPLTHMRRPVPVYFCVIYILVLWKHG